MAMWFPILHETYNNCINKGIRELKTSTNYESDNTIDKETLTNDNRFNDEMIDEAAKMAKEYEKQTPQWIIDRLITTTDECFDFGIYLSKYLIFSKRKRSEDEEKISFPQLYVDFMDKHCKISWKLI